MNKKKIFIAVDTNRISKANKIIRETQTKKIKIGYKFGLEFFFSKNGRKFISNLKNQIIFLDLKFMLFFSSTITFSPVFGFLEVLLF